MKKNSLKRFLAVFLAVAISTFGLFVANTSAESYNGFTYEVKTNWADETQYVVITKYEGSEASVEIPSEIDGLPVTKIDGNAFLNNNTITSVKVPDSVKTIGTKAFSDCSNLSQITLPDSIEEIGINILKNTAYEEANQKDGMLYLDNILLSSNNFEIASDIVVKEGTTMIADSVFFSSEVTSVSLPSSIRIIGNSAFEFCEELTSVNIPNGVESIGSYAFAYCTALENIDIPDTVNTLGTGVFSECTSLKAIDIPASVTEYPMSMLRDSSSITEITIKETVTDLGVNVFAGTKIKSIHIPASVEYIPGSAFGRCTELDTITVDEGNSKYYAKDNIIYSKPYYEGGSESIIRFTCDDSLTSFVVPEQVTYIENDAFSGISALKEITLSSSISVFGYNECSSIENIYVHPDNESLMSIDGILYSKDGKNLVIYPSGKTATEYTVNGEVETIFSAAFKDHSNLTTLTIPATVTTVKNYAINNCENLTTINLNAKTGIESTAINNCYNLKAINFAGTMAEWETLGLQFSYYECEDGLYAYCTDGTIEIMPPAYTEPETTVAAETDTVPATTAPQDTETVTTEPEEDVLVPSEGLKYQTLDSGNLMITGIENVPADLVIPAEIDGVPVEKISLHAFSYNNQLESVKIMYGVEVIGEYAFAECPNLEYVSIPGSVHTIEDNAFWYCNKINNVAMFGAETIGMNAFGYCKSLNSIGISNNLKKVGFGAFFGCDSLENIYFAGVIEDLVNTEIGDSNDPFLNANLNYLDLEPTEPQVSEPIITEPSITQPVATEPETTIPQVIVTTPNTTVAPKPEFELGDVNMDSKINIKDATTIQKYCAKMLSFTAEQEALADFNLDLKINVKDATQIQKKLANLI